ncbi:MAG: penicillin-insensitive murein endopeptidase [Bradymonadales bacterium]|nr:penicillin-insensitive murein endopeptidase [Bradymonadales bacterium]
MRGQFHTDGIMDRNYWIFSALLTLLVTCNLLSGQAWADPMVYVVQSGDALSSLARRYNVTVQQIRDWNQLDGDLIRIGQQLTIHPERGSRRRTGSSRSSSTVHTVQPGDRLSQIARSYDVSVADLVAWNRGLDPDRIRVGQEIRIQRQGREVRRITYEVQPGDFVARIARRHHVSINDIVRWNDGLDPDRIRIGQQLVIYVEGPEQPSRSVGRANAGRLVNGEQLPGHRGYRIRDRDRAWATNETVRYILGGFDTVLRVHPRAHRVAVHDLSRERGGPMRGHRSHQSGRDADFAYYQRRCSGGTCPVRRVRPDNLDVETQWTLFSHWIRHDQVQYMFVDYSLQRVLYEYARDQGATASQLDEWFQYPHGRNTARGIIRHQRNHADHVHVRFTCSDDDDECR